MNFDEAVVAHSAWKRKLGAYLQKPDKSIDAVKLAKDDQCELGKWIQADRGKYASNPAFVELKKEHANFHRAAADVVRRADAGEKVSGELALGGSSAYAGCSTKVVTAILQLKRSFEK